MPDDPDERPAPERDEPAAVATMTLTATAYAIHPPDAQLPPPAEPG